MSKYIVKWSNDRPKGGWGTYRRVAVLEVEEHVELPTMISKRARGVIDIVAVWDQVHVGKTDRDAFTAAMREAEALAAQLNARALATEALECAEQSEAV